MRCQRDQLLRRYVRNLNGRVTGGFVVLHLHPIFHLGGWTVTLERVSGKRCEVISPLNFRGPKDALKKAEEWLDEHSDSDGIYDLGIDSA